MKLHINYLTAEHIKGFDQYKYSSVDTSPVALYISHPFWNQVVKLYPRWLAPNVLTFSGFVLVMLYSFVVAYYDYWMLGASDTHPEFSPVPNWVWLFCAVVTFTAHVLDGTDGKQARLTNMSGPTGELFDHGIDSWLTLPFTITLFSIFGRDDYSVSSFHLLCALASVQLVFVVSHWEKYNTGVLFLPWGYDISQYFLSFFYLLTYFAGGYRMWKFVVIPALGITPAHIAEFSFYLSCFGMSIPMSLYNIKKAYAAGENLHSSICEVMLPLFSTTLLFSLSIIWALLSRFNIIDIDPRAFLWLMGTIFSNIACRLIISQMTGTRCETFNVLLIPFGLGMIISLIWPVVELQLVRILCILLTLAHVHYGVCVVTQMCTHFGIRPFSVGRVDEINASDKLEYHLLETQEPELDI